MLNYGFLNLNKPQGFTSHDCVGRVRRLCGLKRVGHGGTLDPMATGVLPIALGSATRLLQFLPEGKAYRATIRFGLVTDTDDVTGTVLKQQPCPQLSLEQVKAVLGQFQGQIQQVPPHYSAIQVDGQRLYDLARQGKPITVTPRTVKISHLEILDWRLGEFPALELAVTCGPGTYIRSLARDLGALLGVGGTLAALVRTASCGLELGNSLSLEVLETQLQQHEFQPIPAATILTHLPVWVLEPELARRWCLGQKLALSPPEFPEPELPASGAPPVYWRVENEQQLLGIGEWRDGVLRPKVVLPESDAPEPN